MDSPLHCNHQRQLARWSGPRSVCPLQTPRFQCVAVWPAPPAPPAAPPGFVRYVVQLLQAPLDGGQLHDCGLPKPLWHWPPHGGQTVSDFWAVFHHQDPERDLNYYILCQIHLWPYKEEFINNMFIKLIQPVWINSSVHTDDAPTIAMI